jgi:RNA polymerase sigma-70 factor, ECF subfamily
MLAYGTMVPDDPVPGTHAGAAADAHVQVHPGAGVRSATDAALAGRVAGSTRDGAAEAELCRRFATRIRLYGLKHLRDEERARDLVQSVLLAVLEAVRAGRLDDPERLDRFVLGTCRNLALQARRADGRAEPTEPAKLDLVADLVGILPDTDAIDAGVLQRCLAGLDARARNVLYLSFSRDKSADAIARVLETTSGNVRVIRHRAVAQLRSCLDGGRETVP